MLLVNECDDYYKMPSFMAHKHLKKKKKANLHKGITISTPIMTACTPLYDTWRGVALEVPNIGVEIALPFLHSKLCTLP